MAREGYGGWDKNDEVESGDGRRASDAVSALKRRRGLSGNVWRLGLSKIEIAVVQTIRGDGLSYTDCVVVADRDCRRTD